MSVVWVYVSLVEGICHLDFCPEAGLAGLLQDVVYSQQWCTIADGQQVELVVVDDESWQCSHVFSEDDEGVISKFVPHVCAA